MNEQAVQHIHPNAAAFLHGCHSVERHGPQGGNYVESKDSVYLLNESSAAREIFFNKELPEAGVQVVDKRQDVTAIFGKEKLLAQHAEMQVQQAEDAAATEQVKQTQSTGPRMG